LRIASSRKVRFILSGFLTLSAAGAFLWVHFEAKSRGSGRNQSMEHAFSGKYFFGNPAVDTAYNVKPGQVYYVNEVVESDYLKKPVEVTSVSLDVVSGGSRIQVGGWYASTTCNTHPAPTFGSWQVWNMGVNLVPGKPAWEPAAGHWTVEKCHDYPYWFNQITIKKYGEIYIDGVFITYKVDGVTYRDHMDGWAFRFVNTPIPGS